VTFGELRHPGARAAYVTNRQIESARIAINRHIRRGGKVWINIYPDRPLTKKPPRPAWVPARARRSGGSRTSSRARDVRAVVPNEKVAREALTPRDPQAADEVPDRPARGR
jgi:large subunit ribosomal protein L16